MPTAESDIWISSAKNEASTLAWTARKSSDPLLHWYQPVILRIQLIRSYLHQPCLPIMMKCTEVKASECCHCSHCSLCPWEILWNQALEQSVCQELSDLHWFSMAHPSPMEQTNAASLRCERKGVQSEALALQFIAHLYIIHGLCRQFIEIKQCTGKWYESTGSYGPNSVKFEETHSKPFQNSATPCHFFGQFQQVKQGNKGKTSHSPKWIQTTLENSEQLPVGFARACAG